MPKEAELRRLMDEEDLIRWREATMGAEKEATEITPEAPSCPLSFARQPVTNIRSAAQQLGERKQSLLTKGLHPGQEEKENGRPQIYMSTEMERHRSTRSNGSTTSTVDLISDSGLTSPTRTSTPSPPWPNNHTYTSFAPYTLGPKLAKATNIQFGQQQRPSVVETKSETTPLPQPDKSVEELVKKRCISFACGKPEHPKKPVEEPVVQKRNEGPVAQPKPKRISFACAPPPKTVEVPIVEQKPAEPESPKKRTISFACVVPKVEAKPAETDSPKKRTISFACVVPKVETKAVTISSIEKADPFDTIPTPPAKTSERLSNRSPSMSRKSRSSTPGNRSHRESTSTVRRTSQSPEAFRSRKPKYIAADNDDLESSEARFHEFASDEPQDDDWIRKDTSDSKVKITISDTLKKENAIRQLAEEADEEALEEEEDDEDEDDDENDLDDDDDDDEDDDDEDDDRDDTEGDEEEDEDIEEEEENHIRLHAGGLDSIEGSIDDIDSDASDGNESDNEAGFADSDDDSDPLGEYAFWTPGKMLFASSGEANTFRPSMRTHRAPSESSIDSLSHMSPIDAVKGGKKSNRMKPSRKIRIRPGTPDLPDSTDFVCGTLDEDRPLEEAYISCMEARRMKKHHLIPQDIDPSFPTSDPEDEEDEVKQAEESEDGLWLHGKFEDSDSESPHRRRARKSPKHSPKRMHSPPPPAKHQHRSPPPVTRHRSPPPTKRRSPPMTRHHSPPPPRRLFLNSPRAVRPVPSHHVSSPPASLDRVASTSVIFAPLGIRPGLTHTKSLPRRTVGFAQHYNYRTSTLSGAISEEEDDNDGHTRGAIDIVKGLEQKRERRKEKFYSKLCAKARKHKVEPKRPLPGRGAERMKELGLQMAGKTGQEVKGKAEYVLSV